MKLRLSDPAKEDLLEIWEYIAADNEQAANQLAESFRLTFTQLVKFPLLGRERSELLTGLRSFAAGNYVIFYQIGGDILEIVHIRHGATDLENLFAAE